MFPAAGMPCVIIKQKVGYGWDVLGGMRQSRGPYVLNPQTQGGGEGRHSSDETWLSLTTHHSLSV